MKVLIIQLSQDSW